MNKKNIYVGLDVHKNENQVALAFGGRHGELLEYGRISNDLHALDKLISRLRKKHTGSNFHFVYEAGPCGFVIYRYLKNKREDISCIVVAPSKIPKKSGDKVKTDRRDAIQLAKLHRSGELEAIHVPNTEDESIRDLCRARTATIRDLRSNRFRLKAFLLRNGYKYQMKTAWTPSHMAYIRGLTLKDEAQKMIVEEYLITLDLLESKIERYDQMIETQYNTWRWKPAVKALMGMKGVRLLTAITLISELGDIRRFHSPRQLMSFLGLTSSEYSSGEGRSQGSISKCGNSHARSFLVESAQHYKNPPKISQNLCRRQEGLNPEVKGISWNAQVRLHKRYWTLVHKGKNNNQATVAIARELIGFIWSICKQTPLPFKTETRACI